MIFLAVFLQVIFYPMNVPHIPPPHMRGVEVLFKILKPNKKPQNMETSMVHDFLPAHASRGLLHIFGPSDPSDPPSAPPQDFRTGALLSKKICLWPVAVGLLGQFWLRRFITGFKLTLPCSHFPQFFIKWKDIASCQPCFEVGPPPPSCGHGEDFLKANDTPPPEERVRPIQQLGACEPPFFQLRDPQSISNFGENITGWGAVPPSSLFSSKHYFWSPGAGPPPGEAEFDAGRCYTRPRDPCTAGVRLCCPNSGTESLRSDRWYGSRRVAGYGYPMVLWKRILYVSVPLKYFASKAVPVVSGQNVSLKWHRPWRSVFSDLYPPIRILQKLFVGRSYSKKLFPRRIYEENRTMILENFVTRPGSWTPKQCWPTTSPFHDSNMPSWPSI